MQKLVIMDTGEPQKHTRRGNEGAGPERKGWRVGGVLNENKQAWLFTWHRRSVRSAQGQR